MLFKKNSKRAQCNLKVGEQIYQPAAAGSMQVAEREVSWEGGAAEKKASAGHGWGKVLGRIVGVPCSRPSVNGDSPSVYCGM